MDMNIIILIIIGMAAALYIFLKIRKSFKKSGCDSGCGSCGKNCDRD